MTDQNQNKVATIIQTNVQKLKTRLIATNKLLTYVHQTKAEYDAREQLVNQLQQQLAEAKVQVQEKQKQCDDLTIQMQVQTHENNKQIVNLAEIAILAEEAKQKAEDESSRQKAYIEQLEAQSREFEDLKKSTAASKKMTDKERNERNQMNNDLRKAQKELALKDDKISEQQKKIEELQGAKEKLEDDAMEYSLNTEMMQNDIQEQKEESNKMEARLEHLIDENTALTKENSQLKTQIETMSKDTKALKEKVSKAPAPAPATGTSPLTPASTVMGSMSPKQTTTKDHPAISEYNSNINNLKTLLHNAETECEIAKSENKSLKAKLVRLTAQQRSNDDDSGRSNNLRASLQRPTEIANLLSPTTHYGASSISKTSSLSPGFTLDDCFQRDRSTHHQQPQQQHQQQQQRYAPAHRYESPPLVSTAAPNSVRSRSRPPQGSSSLVAKPYSHCQQYHLPTSTSAAVEHTQKKTQPLSREKAILQSKSGLIMPQSSVTLPPQKPKPSRPKLTKLQKFVKYPRKYATQSSFIPLTPVASSSNSALISRAAPSELRTDRDPAQSSAVSRKHPRSEEEEDENIEVTDVKDKEARGKRLKIDDSVETGKFDEDVVDDIALELLGRSGSGEADQTNLIDIKARINQLIS